MSTHPAPLTIVPFEAAHARRVAAWPRDATEAQAWAGGATAFPFQPEQFEGWHEDQDAHPFLAIEADEPSAYGELWVDQVEQEIELARIIVDPAKRSRGIGRSFVAALVAECPRHGFARLIMRVAPGNEAALRCYRAACFEPATEREQAEWNCSQPVPYTWLKMDV